MSKEKKELVSRACESIIVAKDHTQWDESLSEVVENLDSLEFFFVITLDLAN